MVNEYGGIAVAGDGRDALEQGNEARGGGFKLIHGDALARSSNGVDFGGGVAFDAPGDFSGFAKTSGNTFRDIAVGKAGGEIPIFGHDLLGFGGGGAPLPSKAARRPISGSLGDGGPNAVLWACRSRSAPSRNALSLMTSSLCLMASKDAIMDVVDCIFRV